MSFFSNLFKAATPENAIMVREATPTPGVPSSTMPPEPQKPQGADYMERIAYTRSPQQALLVAVVYQAVRLRSDVMSVMPVQYQKKDFEGGNFVQDMRGLGKRINYLLQEEPNPIMTAADMWRLVEINRLLYGNAFVYIERDEFDFPARLWLIKECGYNINNATYASITYLTDHGYETKTNVPASEVMHFPNTFRYPNGWGIPTLQYANETLALNRTIKQQSLETAAKGGRIKGIISEKQPNQGQGTLAFGLLNQGEVQKTAQDMQRMFYSGHDIVSMHGLEDFKNLSMTSQDMQMFEQLGGTNDDAARFFGTPRPLVMLDTNSHYNDYQNATMEFHTRTILPQKNGNEKEIARKLIGFKDYGVRRIHICEKPLLAMDPERQAKVDMLNLQTGACNVNEIRQEHDRPSVENGDVPMASANLMTLDALIAKSGTTELKPGTYTVTEPKNDNQNEETK